MLLFYHIFRYLFLLGVRIASLRNTKAKQWLAGRKNWKEQLVAGQNTSPHQKVVWMHCASLGEFEQGRPILEAVRKSYPHTKLILTFFSPSGYEAQKDYQGVDQVMYLPFDGAKNAQDFIQLVQPTLAIFVKYEFWYFYLTTLKQHQIPVILVSGLFRKSQPFFQWWGSFHRKMLESFSFFFVQDENSFELLQKTGIDTHVVVSGDTRFDRVYEIAQEKTSLDFAENFCTEKTLIAGSTWPEDEALLKEWHQQQPEWKLMIVPHEISVYHISHLKKLFPEAVRLSEINTSDTHTENTVMIVDKMGLLSRLYRYATLCYIGGGLKKSGHHNILEAAVYGKAVVTGPYIYKFSESIALHQIKGSFTVQNGKDLSTITSQKELYTKAGEKAGAFVNMSLGATQKIMSWIETSGLIKK
ncbi:MAG: 3-deoxy-D-manno-octulosonic acid transferase [Bacteroidota bacterium]